MKKNKEYMYDSTKKIFHISLIVYIILQLTMLIAMIVNESSRQALPILSFCLLFTICGVNLQAGYYCIFDSNTITLQNCPNVHIGKLIIPYSDISLLCICPGLCAGPGGFSVSDDITWISAIATDKYFDELYRVDHCESIRKKCKTDYLFGIPCSDRLGRRLLEHVKDKKIVILAPQWEKEETRLTKMFEDCGIPKENIFICYREYPKNPFQKEDEELYNQYKDYFN